MSATTITGVHARRVWDSRGRPTVEAEITLADGTRARAIAPAGASRGLHEAHEMRDGGEAFGGLGVSKACAAVNSPIADDLRGADATDQRGLDDRLIALDGTPQKKKLGGNATVAVSMAAAHAAAASAGVPLYRWLGGDGAITLPRPEIQIFGGGAHAGRRIDIQDLMVVCPNTESFDRTLEITAEVYHAAGRLMAEQGRSHGVADEGGHWPDFDSNEQALETLVRAIERAGFRPGEDVAIALDIAASEFHRDGGYHLALENRALDTGAFCDLLRNWIARYPIISIEDPLEETDLTGIAAFTASVPGTQIIGDDVLVTNAERVRAAAKAGACNAILIKPNQAGTLSEALDAVTAARDAGWDVIVSARSGETEDVTVAHLAIAWRAKQLKVGSFARSERMAKWNEVLRIEESLGTEARYPRW